jgi:AhpD family alkylhydroperoxidase
MGPMSLETRREQILFVHRSHSFAGIRPIRDERNAAGVTRGRDERLNEGDLSMQSRMKNPALILPETMKALLALKASTENRGVPSKTLALIELRASQINGCSVCVDMHARQMKKDGETDERLFAVAAWREAPYFTDAERAALGLTEAVTRLSDRADPVPDAVWDEAKRYYDEGALAALIVGIANINVWNRLNAATRQVAGVWRG